MPLHLVSRLAGPSPWPRRFLSGVLQIIGLRVRTVGAAVAPHTLFIANHVSWADIPVLASATGCAFVSKQELRGHPVMRWLCEQNATVFVDRSDRRGIAEQTAAMVRALGGPQPLTLFAEGTVGDGRQLLPFRPALLSAFAPPPDHVTLRPVALDYGAAAPEFAWPAGEPGTSNFLRLIGRRGRSDVIVRLLPPLSRPTDRKQLARAAQEAVGAALAPSGMARAAL